MLRQFKDLVVFFRCYIVIKEIDRVDGLVVLDEITIPMYFGLITIKEIEELISLKSPGTELVFTGRYASEELKKLCDMVTVVESEKMPKKVPEL